MKKLILISGPPCVGKSAVGLKAMTTAHIWTETGAGVFIPFQRQVPGCEAGKSMSFILSNYLGLGF